jgi:hypothetical protein
VKYAFLIALALWCVSAGATAADKPDFSGDWKMNPAKSAYGPIPMPSSFIRKISHKEPSLVIVEEQTQDGVNQVTKRAVTTDGHAATLDINGTQATCSATWDGNAIIANSAVDSYGITFRDRMTLSADGKVLTSEIQVFSSQGDAAMTIVFDRQ